ncbi:MAG: metallophosphoesterase family protein [Cyclobacteriaceae bacterium]|nr:metallophosphoesterase family protein [Cyclobacteriaceae bacterium]
MERNQVTHSGRILIALALTFIFAGCSEKTLPDGSVKDVMDDLVTRLYSNYNKSQLDTIGHNFVMQFLSPEEKHILSNSHYKFDVDVPVKVSIMRDSDQKVVPFWLPESGFTKTSLTVKNSHSTYEVWQKDFKAGKIGLGINGFDRHRPVYFVSVQPLGNDASPNINVQHPARQLIVDMDEGVFTYHDWTELVLTEVPESLKGSKMFTTIRGRAREAHIVDAFRITAWPSGDLPDQLILTWSADPSNSVDIQWRTSENIANSVIKYWKQGNSDTTTLTAEPFRMEDRMLQNDRYIYRHTAKLRGLEPSTDYQYIAGSSNGGFTDVNSFKTMPKPVSEFSFIWFGDVHNNEKWGELIQKADARHPDNDFYIIAGDLVNTGLHRDDWDELFKFSGNVFASRALMPVPGNHDNQDGLGAWMYKEMFSLPENGPAGVVPEMTYAIQHQNALFLMIDATSPVDAQTSWIREQLAATSADWKFAVFHFPPFNAVSNYERIIDAWVPVFDEFEVDFVMSGHYHYYLRSKPMVNREVVQEPAKGTRYLISIGASGKNEDAQKPDYAEVQFAASHIYQHVKIDGKKMEYVCYDMEGKVRDRFSLSK